MLPKVNPIQAPTVREGVTNTPQTLHPLLITLTCLALLTGCANVRITNPPSTATEQFLLSQSAVAAVQGMTFEPLYGRRVFIDSQYFAPATKEFVLAEFRAKLLNSGLRLVPERKDAEIVMEVRSGGVGIDRYENLFGIPAFTTPGGATTLATAIPMASIITPELAISKKIRQISYASIAYVAYWADTGEVVATGGPNVGKTYREDFWLFGFGPHTTGDIATVDTHIE